MSESNQFDNVEPHRHLPDETRVALWSACQLVLQRPQDFTDAVAWLEQEFSEAVVFEGCKREYRERLRNELRNLRENDPHFLRRRAMRRGKTWRQLVAATIKEAKYRGWRVQDGQVASRNERNIDARIRCVNIEIVWRQDRINCLNKLVRIKKERRAHEIREGVNPADRRWRLELAVHEVSKADMPGGKDEILHARRAVLMATVLSYQHPLPFAGEFCSWEWENTGHPFLSFVAEMHGEASEPYSLGRCTVLFGLTLKPHPHVGSVSLHNFTDLVQRAVRVLESHQLPSAAMKITFSVAEISRRFIVDTGTVRRWCNGAGKSLGCKKTKIGWQIPTSALKSAPWERRTAPKPIKAQSNATAVPHECSGCDNEFDGKPPRPKCPKCGSTATSRKKQKIAVPR